MKKGVFLDSSPTHSIRAGFPGCPGHVLLEPGMTAVNTTRVPALPQLRLQWENADVKQINKPENNKHNAEN